MLIKIKILFSPPSTTRNAHLTLHTVCFKADLLLDQEIRRRTLSTPSAEAVFSCKKCAPIAVPRPSTTQDSTAGTLRASLVPVVLRQDRCPKTNVVNAFSAEGSWDPMFVMAPPRLVGLQNQTAVRKRGRRRARQVAWHRIDDPEVRSRAKETINKDMM